MQKLVQFDLKEWEGRVAPDIQKKAITVLEEGGVVYLPHLSFNLLKDEAGFLSPAFVDPKRKNISYNLSKNVLGGSLCKEETAERLKAMMRRYAIASQNFIKSLFPHYAPHLILSKTSLRPIEITGRQSSLRKDDTRLHVDAFPSNPTQGFRLLRLFTNINPDGKPRVWKVGEPFANVADKFASQISPPLPGSSFLMKLLKITKSRRRLYDHYMLYIHNRMKEDDAYQQTVSQEEIHFPPGSSWIVFTDQVSHAALAGKDLLEQTFFLPPDSLKNPATAPFKILEKSLNKTLL